MDKKNGVQDMKAELGYKSAKKCGISQDVWDKFQSNGVSFHINDNYLEVHKGTIKVYGEQHSLKTIKDVVLSIDNGSEMYIRLKDAYSWALSFIEKINTGVSKVLIKPLKGTKESETKKLLGKKNPSVVGVDLAKPEPNKYTSKEVRASAQRVNLRKAEHMFQPVYGTSEGSRYFYIGRSTKENIKVAIRYIHNSLSVRLEGECTKGEAVAFFGTSIPEFQIKNSPDGWYSSLHFENCNDQLCRKVLGSVLFGLQLYNPCTSDDVMQLKGEG